MKRAVFILVLAVVAVCAGSCTYDPIDAGSGHSSKSLTIRLGIEDLSTDNPAAATRGTIPAAEGEWNVNSLNLFFYKYAEDGGGVFIKHLDKSHLGADVTPVMNGRYSIDLAAAGIDASKDYVILALANVEDILENPEDPNSPVAQNGYTDNEGISGLVNRLSILNERQAIETATALVKGVDVVETDDGQKISPANLLMSARVVRKSTDSEVEVRLTRAVARFEVALHANVVAAGYELVSASIWSAASDARIWDNRMTTAPQRMKRFYGLKKDNNDFTGNKIVSGLYAFENYVANPHQDDKVTTSVIVGLKKGEDSPLYYRINVARAGESQNLRRNYDYRIRINDVTGEGSQNEYSAWAQAQNELVVSINEWNLDDNGMVVTDGVNTMILPVKLARLDPKGEVREFTIHTIGSATLSISQESFPDGAIKAELVGGTLLRVTADPMTGNIDTRQGSIELSYGALRGTVSFVQAADNGLHLSLNRYEIPAHLPLGYGGIPDNIPFSVTASGSWTATIYNMSPEGGDNPGFSFNSGGAVKTELKSTDNPFGNIFQIYTTGANSSSQNARNGFVMVTLDEDPDHYSRVVVLSQYPATNVTFKPALGKEETLRFSPVGVPSGLSNVPAEQGYTFTIDPGKTAGVTTRWDVVADNGDTEYFEIVKIPNPFDENSLIHRFSIIAKGTSTTPDAYPYNDNRHMNLFSRPLNATFKVKYGANLEMEASTIKLVQTPAGISISTRGTNVSRLGGHIDDVTVNIDPSLHWTAEIFANKNYTVKNAEVDRPHKGYLYVGGERYTTETGEGDAARIVVTGQTASTKLSAGFDKIYYPLVGESPRMTVRVSLVENPSVYTEFDVTQSALTAAPVKIIDAGSSWGALTGGDHYFDVYRSYINNRTMFGPSGKMVETNGTPAVTTRPNPTSVEDSYTYLHAARPARFAQNVHTAINDWWERAGGERLLLYSCDVEPDNDNLYYGSTRPDKRTTVLSTLGLMHANNATRLTFSGVTGNLLYQYLTVKGPAGAVSTSGVDFYSDGYRSAVSLSSLPANAVPLLMHNSTTVSLFVDPENNLVFIGDCVAFYPVDDYVTAENAASGNWGNAADDAARSKFLVNLISYIHLAAQYGTHFTDLFITNADSSKGKSIADIQKLSGGDTPADLFMDAFGN